jgi:hypothetical protein
VGVYVLDALSHKFGGLNSEVVEVNDADDPFLGGQLLQHRQTEFWLSNFD